MFILRKFNQKMHFLVLRFKSLCGIFASKFISASLEHSVLISLKHPTHFSLMFIYSMLNMPRSFIIFGIFACEYFPQNLFKYLRKVNLKRT